MTAWIINLLNCELAPNNKKYKLKMKKMIKDFETIKILIKIY